MLGSARQAGAVQVNVGRAKTELSKLIARVEAGEEVEIARNGIPIVRLVRVDNPPSVGARFLAARGALTDRIVIGDDFEFSETELDGMLHDER